MEIQLTRTKTITIGGGPKKRKPADVVGVDLFSGDSRGCPAVRLVERKGDLRLSAVGFVPAPANPLPDSWESAAKSCTWSLPAPFQATNAAIAVTSPDMFFAQTTPDAFKSDFSAGAHKNDDDAAAKPKRIGIRRETKPVAPATTVPDMVPGVPVSNGGTRFVMKPMPAAEGFVMEAGLPEYQILWLSRLLPEGRRPTASSVQVRPAAMAAGVLRQPAFLAESGSALALFISEDETNIAGYKGGDIVLWRTCRGIGGWRKIREALKRGLGLEDDMIAGVLEDTLIDPRPVLEPVVAPVIDELAVSRDYLVGKLGVEPKSALAFGLPAGIRYWNAIAEDRVHLPLVAPGTFDGLERSDKIHVGEGAALDGAPANVFLGALGAALALIGEEDAS